MKIHDPKLRKLLEQCRAERRRKLGGTGRYVVSGAIRGKLYAGNSLSAAKKALSDDHAAMARLGVGAYSDAHLYDRGRLVT